MMAAKTKVEIDIDITPDMLAAGLQVLVDSGVLDRGASRELPTGADEVLVADMYRAMVRARSGEAAVQVTLPGVPSPALSSSSRTRPTIPYASLPIRTKGSRCAIGLNGPDGPAPRSSH
jgi:hypothetical protein